MTTGSEIIESVVIGGDLSKLTTEQRVSYYKAVCESLKLNPLTKPFDYITLNGKLTLYARKDAADQLRKLHDVSITKLERERIDSIYTVTAYAQDKSGRTDSSIGAVNIEGLKGDALANAVMKAETKSKRRVTLSICGLGMLDETELETIKEYTEEVVPPVVPEKVYIPSNLDVDWVDKATSSGGDLLIDMTTEKLSHMANSLITSVKDYELTPMEKEAKQHELKAIEIILADRSQSKKR